MQISKKRIQSFTKFQRDWEISMQRPPWKWLGEMADFACDRSGNFILDTTVDGHVHTSLCHHAQGQMEEYVLSAIDRGLRKLIFLEHLEVGIEYFECTWLTEEDFAQYHAEGKRLQEKYRSRIEIGLGVEVGYNPRFQEKLLQLLAMHTWDRIGISYHFLETAAGQCHRQRVFFRFLKLHIPGSRHWSPSPLLKILN